MAWPTSLGWMMGPFLIFGALLNGAAVAIFEGAPHLRGFGQMVQDAKVGMVGCVPALVKAWRASRCMEGLNFSAVKAFITTGEASAPDDSLWLMSRVRGYRPLLEMCGGTELSGGYQVSTSVLPVAPSTFNSPCLGMHFVLLDDTGAVVTALPAAGEVAIVRPFLGGSQSLLNADHHKVYFNGMPRVQPSPSSPYGSVQLRRHGDRVVRLLGGSSRAGGRVDDAMNLGGIKTSALEIERACVDAHPAVAEVAAVSVPPPGGGPEELWLCAALRPGRQATEEELRKALGGAVRSSLNPLFKVSAVLRLDEPALPRTASNKVLRRLLRARCVAQAAKQAKPLSKL